ncbi:MAG: transcriptional repressor [Gammaproteobacteria bacterium]|nr:transcriptional repressor [Gammaproteobacteria bacterium]
MTSLSQPVTKSRHQISLLLRESGINPTPQRVNIAALLLERKQHISADEILAGVNRNSSLVSKATVYNTLNLFVEKGLIREVLIDPSRVFYDSNTCPHHHMYNVDTGQLTDIAAADLHIDKLPQLPEGVSLEGVDLIIRVKNG